MDEEILCVAKWQKALRTIFPKIANGEAIFVRSKGAKAQHSSPM